MFFIQSKFTFNQRENILQRGSIVGIANDDNVYKWSLILQYAEKKETIQLVYISKHAACSSRRLLFPSKGPTVPMTNNSVTKCQIRYRNAGITDNCSYQSDKPGKKRQVKYAVWICVSGQPLSTKGMYEKLWKVLNLQSQHFDAYIQNVTQEGAWVWTLLYLQQHHLQGSLID